MFLFFDGQWRVSVHLKVVGLTMIGQALIEKVVFRYIGDKFTIACYKFTIVLSLTIITLMFFLIFPL